MSKKQTTTSSPKTSNYGANRLKRILRHLKKHSQDLQAKEALELGKTVSTRKASLNKLGWLSTDKEVEGKLRSKFIGGITKEALIKEAQVLKFIKNAPFHAVATISKISDKITLSFKHTSKLSNFKPKS